MLGIAKVFAQADEGGKQIGTLCGSGLGPFGKICDWGTDGTKAFNAIANLISSVIGVLTIAAGIWFLIQVLIGGFNWITSGGDKAKLQDAQHRITNAFVGLIIVVAGWGILALAGTFFDVDFGMKNPGTIIQLSPDGK